MIDHAVLMAAGKGERLWPLTEHRPKPLVPIANEPLLVRLMRQLAEAGIGAVTVVVADETDAVAACASETGKRLDVAVDLAVQAERRGTGHALQQVPDLDAKGRVLVTYGDLFLPSGELSHLLERATALASDEAVIAAREVPDASDYGALDTDGDQLRAIAEKSNEPPSNLINAGLYVLPPVFEPHLFSIKESPRGELELTDAIEASIDAGGTWHVHTLDRWLDVGWPWDVLAANELALAEMEPAQLGTVEEGAVLKGPVRVEEGALVKAGARLEGPVLVGPGATVGPNCLVRASTTIGPGCKVGNGCEVKNSVLFENAKVPHLSYVGDSVLGRNVNLGAGTQVANLRHDGDNLLVDTPRGRIDSGRRKLGVILGDGVKTGINATLNCGVVLPPGQGIAPGEIVMRSRLPDR